MTSLVANERYSVYFQKMRFLYKRPEIQASLEVILSVFTVLFLVFAAIRPTIINIVSLQKKIEDQEVINKKADNKIAQLINAQNQLSIYGDKLRLFESAVPDSFAYTGGAKRLEYIARNNNVAIDTLVFSGYKLIGGAKINSDWASKISSPTKENSLPNKLTFSINGKPQNVILFLSQIEKMDRLASLDSVTLLRQVGLNKTDDVLKATGQITFYFYSEK